MPEPAKSLPVIPLNPHSRIPMLTPEASVAFIGNATTLLTYHGARILTDPNFLHAGDHVHLGPGVTATRTKNPSVDITSLPPIDLILLSHYHEDHFDRFHTPPGPANLITKINDLLGAVPPINGWLLALGHLSAPGLQTLDTGYRIYVSGDTLLVDRLREIPRWLAGARVDLMIVHLGATTIPGPRAPLVMVKMDARRGWG
ncbi:hypothetical protein B0T18DRAFT_447320 [Schizothecium vesticola]|uniref:Metallo-hydrolase/oxidoreductase n=1 Tax=Schizothecium vesticola TaxID=314040 RepID=A0AA40EWL2_9PEZI|nr:hypothetical protein B0T18DRAFT_447320 [Schizothecium vesticola]